MPTLTEGRIASLLLPYVGGLALPPAFYESISTYIDLLLRWNSRTNLTAIREPEMLIQRQVGESILAAAWIRPALKVLDFGSGAGFPGIPLQLAEPHADVTLAESQGKKASFLKEAVRTLGLRSSVWADRVENLPAGSLFDVVTMRAVDSNERMTGIAVERVAKGGCLLRYSAEDGVLPPPGWKTLEQIAVPRSPGLLFRQVRL